MTSSSPATVSTTAVGRRVQPGPAPAAALAAVYALRPRAMWAYFVRQPASFKLLCLYLIFEYVRPQQIYPALTVVPWAQLLLVLIPLMWLMEGFKVPSRDPILFWLAVFTGAVALSSVLAQYPSISWQEMYIYVNWLLVYLLLANLAGTDGRYFIFLVLFVLCSLKMSQHGTRIWVMRGFAFEGWGATGAPGWFQNSGEFGIQMCIFLPLSIYFIAALKRRVSKRMQLILWVLPFTAVASMIASSSRGALLGAAGIGLWILLRTRYRFRALISMGVATAAVLFVLPPQFKQRFQTMGDDKTSEQRKTYWRHGIEMFKEQPAHGIGYANWAEVYRDRYRAASLPHNIFVQAGAELGVPGLIGMLGLIVSSFIVNYRTRRLMRAQGEDGHVLSDLARGLDGAMIGFLISGFFITVLYYPFFWFNLGMTSALHTAARQRAGRHPVGVVAAPARRPAEWRTARMPLQRPA